MPPTSHSSTTLSLITLNRQNLWILGHSKAWTHPEILEDPWMKTIVELLRKRMFTSLIWLTSDFKMSAVDHSCAQTGAVLLCKHTVVNTLLSTRMTLWPTQLFIIVEQFINQWHSSLNRSLMERLVNWNTSSRKPWSRHGCVDFPYKASMPTILIYENWSEQTIPALWE